MSLSCRPSYAVQENTAIRSSVRPLLFGATATPSKSIVVSGTGVCTQSLYQACKLLAAVAPVALPGANIVLVAECAKGTGPVDVVNSAIYELGIAPRLRANQVILVSSLTEDSVKPTFCRYANTVEEAVSVLEGPRLIVPDASEVLLKPSTGP